MNSPRSKFDDGLIAEVVGEVLARLGHAARATTTDHAHDQPASHDDGVFANVDEAVAAAVTAQRRLAQSPLATRRAAVACVREIMRRDRDELARIEFAETQIGRLDHKLEKLDVAASVPGIEMLRSEAVSGDCGLTVTEYAPYGVIGVVTPVTHSIPTLGCNAIMMIAAGNTLVCNPHPSGARCAVEATRRWNRLIRERTGLDNLICIIENPTIESAGEIFHHPDIAMLCATGGAAVAHAAMSSGKRAVVAGPGNPPVVVDETADIDKAARGIITGASYDNNLLCIAEKEVFVVEAVAERLMGAMEAAGAVRLTTEQIDAFAARFVHKDPRTQHWLPEKRLIGKDPRVLAEALGLSIDQRVPLLFGQTGEHNPLVPCEQMMPILPIVPVRDVDEAIAKAVHYEHGFKHTALMWSQSVDNLTRMGRACDTTLFVKNGPCMAGLGAGGEGYGSFSIATPTGEGVTSPMAFARYRRCVMVDGLRII